MIHGLNVLYPDTEWPEVPVKHVRLWDMGVHWGAIHVAPHTFNWDRLDSIVNRARANGTVNLTYTVSATPTWLSTTPAGTTHAPWLNPGSNYPPFSVTHFDEWFTALTERYRGRIGSYQIWNEPQIKWFWYPRPFAAVAEMTHRAHRILAETDPGAKIIAASLVPSAVNAATHMPRFLTALKGRGCPVHIWSAHVYTEPGQGPEDWRHLVEAWRRALVTAGVPKRPRWVTETNVNMGGGPVSDRRVSLWMSAVDEVAESEGLVKTYWYAYGTHTDPELLGIPFVAGSRGMLELQRLNGG